MPTCQIAPYGQTPTTHRSVWYPRSIVRAIDWYQTHGLGVKSRGLAVPASVAGPTWNASTDELEAILECIRQSASIAGLPVDWDDEDGPRYSQQTLDRATDFLYRLACAAYAQATWMGIPTISPADEGSIDLFWKDDARHLLINILANEHEEATYFGQNQRGDTIAGPLLTSVNRPDLIRWLRQKL